MSVGALNYLSKSQYSSPFIVAAFSKNTFSSKTSLPVKNSYLSICSDGKPEILLVSLTKSYWGFFSRFCYQLFHFSKNTDHLRSKILDP